MISCVLETNVSVIKSQITVSEHDIYHFTIVILKTSVYSFSY